MRRAMKLLALPLALSAAGAAASAQESTEGLSCEIRTVADGDAVTLQAIVLSLFSARGEYELEVSKSGGGGTSSSTQAGDFEVAADGEALLTEITIGGGGSVQALLTVYSAKGDVVCEAALPAEL